MRRIYNLLFSLLFISLPLWANPTQVEIKTNKGSFVVELFDDTPIHRDNFIKHVKAKDYNNAIFHRVIKNFMVQCGGNIKGGNDETAKELRTKYNRVLTPEFRYPQHVHCRGALAAARIVDESNPDKLSDSYQFFIVTGTFYLDEELEQMAPKLGYEIPKEVKEIYMTKGGSPHLDKNYTVFGQVIKGYRTIEKIANVEIDSNDKPSKDIYIKSMKIISK